MLISYTPPRLLTLLRHAAIIIFEPPPLVSCRCLRLYGRCHCCIFTLIIRHCYYFAAITLTDVAPCHARRLPRSFFQLLLFCC